MSRISVEYPGTTLFTTTIVVDESSVNFANHLAHDHLITLLQESRQRFFEYLGLGSIVRGKESTGVIVAGLTIEYINEAFLGDELTFELSVDSLSNKSCCMHYLITAGKSKTVAKAKTAIVFFDYSSRRATKVPKAFISQIQSIA